MKALTTILLILSSFVAISQRKAVGHFIEKDNEYIITTIVFNDTSKTISTYHRSLCWLRVYGSDTLIVLGTTRFHDGLYYFRKEDQRISKSVTDLWGYLKL